MCGAAGTRWAPLLTFAAILAAAPARAPGDLHEQTLRRSGIAADTYSLGEYLREVLSPLEEQRRRVAPLVKQLESDHFHQRETAMRKLLGMRVIPAAAIEAVAAVEAPDVAWRVKTIVARARRRNSNVLHAALETIDRRPIHGLLPEMMRMVPRCRELHSDRPYLLAVARRSLASTATSDDLPQLREAIGGGDADLRVASTTALGRLVSDQAPAELAALLDDKQDSVALAAARALANAGRRSSLAALVRLLNAPDVDVRVGASLVLRELTGQRFHFAAYDTPQRRAEAAGRWQQWLEKEGAVAALHFPLRSLRGDISYLNGNLLVACGGRGKVVELDPDGKEVFTYTVNNPWSAEKLANGNYLIAAYGVSQVLEVDPKGQTVWHYPFNCLNAKPLPNGNVLLAGYSPRKVVEVNREKQIVWEYTTPGNCADAQRLENGNTLIAAGNQVLEVTPDKQKIAWQWQGGTIYGARRLDNGNTLISDISKDTVVEVNPESKLVWKVTEHNPADAQRLPNGNTLITSSTRVVEVDPEGKLLWQKPGLVSYGTARM